MKVFTKTGKVIKIGKHGRQRLSERLLIDDYHRAMVRNAYEKGDDLNERERQIEFRKGLYNDNYWSSVLKKYNGHIYVFRYEKSSIIFVTII